MRALGADVRVVTKPDPETGDLLERPAEARRPACSRRHPTPTGPTSTRNPVERRRPRRGHDARDRRGARRRARLPVRRDQHHRHACAVAPSICASASARRGSSPSTPWAAPCSAVAGPRGCCPGSAPGSRPSSRAERRSRPARPRLRPRLRRSAAGGSPRARRSSPAPPRAASRARSTGWRRAWSPAAAAPLILADGGAGYLGTVYDDDWVERRARLRAGASSAALVDGDPPRPLSPTLAR